MQRRKPPELYVRVVSNTVGTMSRHGGFGPKIQIVTAENNDLLIRHIYDYCCCINQIRAPASARYTCIDNAYGGSGNTLGPVRQE